MAHSRDVNRNCSGGGQNVLLIIHDLKLPLKNMFKGLKETRYEELKDSMANMCH